MKNRLPVLIADEMHPALMNGLEAYGFPFDYQPSLDAEEILRLLPHYCGLVIRSKLYVDKNVLLAGPNLRFIARAGSGMDNIDEKAAAELGIVCLNAPEGNEDAVGEHAVALLLSLTRNLSAAFEEVKAAQWNREKNRGFELTEMTVAVIGFGHTGKAFARKVSGFGGKVLFYDKNPEVVPTSFAEAALWDQVLKQADVLSFHVPLDEENRGLISKALINSVEKPFFLLNLSRGGIMKTRDILLGLEQGKILGAGLDVLENEKPDTWTAEENELFRSLIATGKVIVTPHIGGWTFSSYRKISEVLLSRIISVLSRD